MASTSRTTAAALLRNVRQHSHSIIGQQTQASELSAIHASKCRKKARYFSSFPSSHSAWSPGQDAASDSVISGGSSFSIQKLPPVESSVTPRSITELKAKGEPIAVLTAYDYPSALSLRAAPIDVCLVGDSLANVALGMRTTQQVTLEAMIHHTQAVTRAVRNPVLNHQKISPIPLIITDLPYGYPQGSLEKAVEAATALVQQGGADGVKIEGTEEILPLVRRLSAFGMPVMAHIGLQPQKASSSSFFQMQARTAKEAFALLQSAIRLQEAGAFSIVLECIPTRVGKEVSKRLRMPTIGIGAGKGCDGQVLVADDLLGECTSPLHILAGVIKSPSPSTNTEGETTIPSANANPTPSAIWPDPPRFARGFAKVVTGGSTLGAIRIASVQAYVEAVKSGDFPSAEEGYKMKKEEWATFQDMLADFDRGLQSS